MRIAITIERLDIRRGGAEVGAVRLIRDLCQRGHEVHLFTEAVAVELPANVQSHLIPVRLPGVALRQIVFAKRIQRALKAGCFDASVACGRALSEDIIWSQNGTHPANVAGAMRANYHRPWLQALRRYQDFYSLKGWVYRKLEAACFARQPQPFVIAVSSMVAGEYQNYYGVDPARIRTAYYQTDLGRFTPAQAAALRGPARAALGLNERTLAILVVSQNFKRKGVRPIIEATALLQARRKDFCVLIAGGYKGQIPAYSKLAGQLGCGGRVRFMGPTRRIEELYAAADVFCLPSFYDSFGMVVLEAMACGRATIASRYSGAAELIRHGENGLLLKEPDNPGELLHLLESLFDQPQRDRLGAAALATAQSVCHKDSENAIGRLVEEFARRLRHGEEQTPTVQQPSFG